MPSSAPIDLVIHHLSPIVHHKVGWKQGLLPRRRLYMVAYVMRQRRARCMMCMEPALKMIVTSSVVSSRTNSIMPLVVQIFHLLKQRTLFVSPVDSVNWWLMMTGSVLVSMRIIHGGASHTVMDD